MRIFQKEIMNQKTKIVTAIVLLSLYSMRALAVDAPNFGSQQLAKDTQAQGLAKGEGVVKETSSTASATLQNLSPKVSDPAVAGSGLATSSQVTSLPPAWPNPSFADLEKLRSENAMLAEQLKNAELKNKINAQGGSPIFSGSGSAGQSGALSNKAPSGPKVVMIAGGEGNYRANILLASGQSFTAGNGSNVPGIGVVSAITPDTVYFGSGKTRRSLSLITSGANADFVMGQ